MEKLRFDDIRQSTKTNYYSVWRTFNQFFIKLDVKPSSWEDRLVLFVGHLIQENKNSQTIRSYVSAIKKVLRNDGVTLDEDTYLINALTRACKLHNDRVLTRFPIQKGLLRVLLHKTESFFEGKHQSYLATLYTSMFATAYYGLFRVGEITESEHNISVTDVHIGQNKDKLLFVLRSSKTHGRNNLPQKIKISRVGEGIELKVERTGVLTNYFANLLHSDHVTLKKQKVSLFTETEHQ